MGQHLDQVRGQERRLSRLCCSQGPADALQGFGDEDVGGGGRVGITGRRVRLGDRGEAARDGGGPADGFRPEQRDREPRFRGWPEGRTLLRPSHQATKCCQSER